MSQQHTREEVLARVEEFCKVVEKFCNDRNINSSLYKIVITAQVGQKNVKIVRRESWNGAEPTNGSVHCFIDIETGNILKAASWKVPAKGVRGSIFKDDFDVGIGKAVGEFGAAYLR
jgi:hypothetical protein